MRFDRSLIFHVSSILVIAYGQDIKFATDCITPNNAQGLCVEVQKCKKLYDQIVQDNVKTFTFIRASRCGPPNEDLEKPKVCCGPDIDFVREQACTTPNQERARCIPLASCKLFYDYIVESGTDHQTNQYIGASQCGRNSDGPLVCCGSDLKLKKLVPNRNECGYQEGFKVINGEDTDITEFPWMALLQQTKQTGMKAWGCGGSVINSRYILTAAHCVSSATSRVTLVRLGEWNLDTPQDCIGPSTYRICSKPPQNIEVEETIPHPEYTRTKQGVFNDIALIRLAQPMTFNEYVKPICLPLPQEASAIGTRSYVAGWGAVSEKQNYSPIKQKLKVPILETQVCQNKFGPSGITINNKMICAGGEKDKDSCKGDSGGPLISEIGSASGQFYVEGVVSYGHARCGTEGFPAIYTRVSDFLDWIHANIKP